MPMTEDLALFFDTEEHGTEVLIDGSAVTGIFDRGYAEVAGMGTTEPTFVCPAAEAAGVEQDSELVNGSDTYSVRSVEPDGSGLVRMTLEAVS